MSTYVDTLSIARKLKEAGFNTAQAEAIPEAIMAAAEDTLVTKQDLMQLEHRLTVKIFIAQFASLVATASLIFTAMSFMAK